MKNKQIVLAVVVIVLVAGTYLYKKYRIAPNVNFDSLKLTDLRGNPVELSKFTNKTLFINFFATWCGPCVAELPSLYAASKTLEENNFQFIYISDESTEKLLAFQNRMQLPITIYHSETSLQEQNIFTIPTSYVLSKKFEILYQKVGVEDWESSEVLKNLKELSL